MLISSTCLTGQLVQMSSARDDDTITLDGLTVTGTIEDGLGIDTINLLSGTVITGVLGQETATP